MLFAAYVRPQATMFPQRALSKHYNIFTVWTAVVKRDCQGQRSEVRGQKSEVLSTEYGVVGREAELRVANQIFVLIPDSALGTEYF
jgi:hypothetical protein